MDLLNIITFLLNLLVFLIIITSDNIDIKFPFRIVVITLNA